MSSSKPVVFDTPNRATLFREFAGVENANHNGRF